MAKLTLFWGDKSASDFYWCVDDLSTQQTSSAIPLLESHRILKADLACIADMAKNCKVELVVSATDIHFNQVVLPNKAQRHIRKAVPFMLEEQLADSVDDVFVALGKKGKENQNPVRVIRTDYLENIITQFAEAEIKLDKVFVDLDLVPVPEQGYALVLSEGQALVATEEDDRWHCDSQDFTWLVQKQLANDGDEEELPVAIPMVVTVESESQYNEFANQLPVGRFAPQMQLVDSINEFLASHQDCDFNILQGEYEPKAENSPLKNMLLKVANVAGIVLAAHILFQGSQLVALNAQEENLSQQREVLYKQAFPRSKVKKTDRELRTFLKGLGGGQGEGAFLAMMQTTTSLIENLNQLYPTNISYNSARNELRVDLIAKDLPVLNQYRDSLQQAGYEVEAGSASQRGDGYSSRLIIRRK